MVRQILTARDGNELVGRKVKNSLGVDETAIAPKGCWKYYDWCIEHGLDMASWVQDMDEIRSSETSLGEWLWICLWEHHCVRYYHEFPCPPGPPPIGYVNFVEDLDKEANDEEKHEWIGRNLKGALGVEETVVMQRKYWEFFDYLIDIGGDMDKWVVDADLVRHQTCNKNDLSAEVMASLRRFERAQYLKNANLPLFISPRGYVRPAVDKDTPPVSERVVTDSTGQKIKVKLQESYWHFFDWLACHEMDMDQWVKDADISRHKGDLVITLQSEIMLNLRKEERQRFFDGRPCPLYIRPDGYP